MNTFKNAEGFVVRVKTPERRQMEMRTESLDQLLPHDHQARVLWQYVCGLELSSFYRKIQAVEGGKGRDAVDPRILLCLWLLATLEGISSARRVSLLCQRDLPYLWICGGVGVNRDLLTTFRCAHPEALDELMTETVGTLLHQQLISLERVAQDGMRVRASAGKSSFRREGTLQEHLRAAREQVEQLRQQGDEEETDQPRTRSEAARERAARERLERIEQALAERDKLHQQKERRKKGSGAEARASTTDPEARNMKTTATRGRAMKMGDGGYRPAYNVQFATTAGSQIIVGVDVTNQGTDAGLMTPMVDQIEAAYGQTPQEYLADGGFNAREDVSELERRGVQTFVPIKQEQDLLNKGKDPSARQPGDTDEYAQWRRRMQTDEAKDVYRQRSATAEFPNAGCRNRGLSQFRVRGLEKVRTIAVWQALAHNFQMIRRHKWLGGLLPT